MPRMAERIAGPFAANPVPIRRSLGSLSTIPRERISSVGEPLSTEEYDGSDEVGIFDIFGNANMDGVTHLNARDRCTRNVWRGVLVLFIFLVFYHIYCQVQLYFKYPVATNIEAEYPSKIAFPAVAICNNNNFRLTYITGPRVMNRRPREFKKLMSNATGNSIFDQALRRVWDTDAVRFLRAAAHWKSRMILGCTWPDGTACRLSDFQAVWTMNGLCWAINTDPHNPVHVTGSGAQHGLRLLLNTEIYERIDACTPYFRSPGIPGMKVLIYNQSDVPVSSKDGVNVPPGYSMGIPFRMQHRTKLPGVGCKEEEPYNIEARDKFESEDNIRTCVLRRYLAEIESKCHCSMMRAFVQFRNISSTQVCTVDQFFGCVQGVIKKIQEIGSNAACRPPCQVMDYIAWQDMNRMPSNLMPAVIEENEEEDEEDVATENMDEDAFLDAYSRQEETFSCMNDAYLDERQVANIKRDAHRAYEKQSRHQEDVFLKTTRLVERLRTAITNIIKLQWGWQEGDFLGIYARLEESVSCFANFSERHEAFANIMKNRPPLSEEKRASQVFYLVDPENHQRAPNRFKTIGDVKNHYGDRVETVMAEIQTVLTMIEKMWALYQEKTYSSHLSADLSRMDRIISLMANYEDGSLQRRAWAEKMRSRQMRHFFEDDFTEGYYQVIMKDLDQTLSKTIHDLETDEWPKMNQFIRNGTAFKTGAMLFFEDPTTENEEKFKDFLYDIHNCTMNEVRNVSEQTLKDFKKAFRQLHAAYSNLFDKELPDFLENFEFGPKFVSDNFAMVNVFLHQMHIEKWSQDTTYTFWSLACDVGGALGLFLGASLLTLIELIYLCYQTGFCGDVLRRVQFRGSSKLFSCDCVRQPRMKRVKRPSTYSSNIGDYIEKAEHPLNRVHHEPLKPKRTSIWKSPKRSPHHAKDHLDLHEKLPLYYEEPAYEQDKLDESPSQENPPSRPESRNRPLPDGVERPKRSSPVAEVDEESKKEEVEEDSQRNDETGGEEQSEADEAFRLFGAGRTSTV